MSRAAAGFSPGSTRLVRDEAVVLRTHPLGEADRIVTLLTRQHGRVRAVAKGVRRTRSRFGARLEPGSHVQVMIYPGRSLDIVTEAHQLDSFGESLVGDWPRWTSAAAVLETAERLTAEEDEPNLRLFLLVVGALRTLANDAHPAGLVLDAFLLRALSQAGYEPALDSCARCSAPGQQRAFSVPMGGAVCPDCRPDGAASPSHEAIALMVALLRSDWPSADASDPRARREASGLVAAHLTWHLERGLRSLPHVERA